MIFMNLVRSSSCAMCDDSANCTHFTFGMCVMKGSIALSCASSYLPFNSRVGTVILCSSSRTVHSLSVPAQKNSDGPHLYNPSVNQCFADIRR